MTDYKIDDEYFEPFGSLEFGIKFEQDHDMRAPWAEYDGYGVIHKIDRFSYLHEVVLKDLGRDGFLVYNLKKTLKKAKKEGWGYHHDSGFAKHMDHTKEIIDNFSEVEKLKWSIRSAFQNCYDYVHGNWFYVALKVTLYKNNNYDSEGIGNHYLGGIDYASNTYTFNNDHIEEYINESKKDVLYDLANFNWHNENFLVYYFNTDTIGYHLLMILDHNGKVLIERQGILAEALGSHFLKLKQTSETYKETMRGIINRIIKGREVSI